MRRAIELTVLVITMAITAAALGYLIYEGVLASETRPMLRVELEEMTPKEGSGTVHRALFTVTNEGGVSARSATVELSATLPDGSTEKGQVTFDFVPLGSSRSAVVEFSDRPDEGTVESRIVSYELP